MLVECAGFLTFRDFFVFETFFPAPVMFEIENPVGSFIHQTFHTPPITQAEAHSG